MDDVEDWITRIAVPHQMSRLVVIGFGDNGNSRVIDIRNVVADTSPRFPGVRAIDLWDTLREVPVVPPRRRRVDAYLRDIKVSQGATRWVMLSLNPNLTTPFHYTSTLDLVVVLRGEVALGLEEDEITLRAGDHVIVPGAMHFWRTGSSACSMSVMHCGVAPADSKSVAPEDRRKELKLEMWEVICRSLSWLA